MKIISYFREKLFLPHFTFINLCFFSRFLLGRHEQAVENFTEVIEKMRNPDWETHHNLGKLFVFY